MTGPPTPSNQEGPNTGPPSLPEGWLAQWEGQSRKYYYVQRATGHSQWDIPTQPALSVPTPDPTPQQYTDPFNRPTAGYVETQADGTAVVRDSEGNVVEADRSLLGDLAINAITGGKHKPQNQSGLGGLASSFLGGGQSSHSGGGSGSSSGAGLGGLAGQLLGSFADGGKPSKPQQQQQQQQQQSSQPSSGTGHGGGFMSLLGGHHGSSNSNSYGYSSSGQGSSSGGYSGQAPPASYQPAGQHHQGSTGTQHQQQPIPSQYGSQNQSQQSLHHYGSSSANIPGTAQSLYGGPSQYVQSGQGTSGAPSHGQQNPTSHDTYAQQYQSSGPPISQHHGHGHHGHHKPPQDSQGPGSSQYNPQQSSYNPSFPGPPPSPYGNSQSSTPAYNQPNQLHSYPPPPPPSSSSYGQQPQQPYPQNPQSQQPPPYGGQYPPQQPSYGTPLQNNYPPPPQNTPAYVSQPQHQSGYNNPYPPAPPMSSHPSQQGPGPGQNPNHQLSPPQSAYPPRPSSSGGPGGAYPGQPAYGHHQQQPPQGQRPLAQSAAQSGEHLPHGGYLTGANISPQPGYQQPPPPPPPNTQQSGQQHGGGQVPGQWDPYR